MPYYSDSSRGKLNTCHHDLQTIFNYVIKDYDCTIVYGHRPPKLQFELYMKGREKLDSGEIVITDRSEVVTYKDGISNKSKHNRAPSLAVDAIPYFPDHPHIRWHDHDVMRHFAGRVLATADLLRRYGAIESRIRWGGNWDQDMDLDDQSFMDLVHFEIV
jgi:peptidoglycan L-alanyl-D-glutamate endopeptidase CwlK